MKLSRFLKTRLVFAQITAGVMDFMLGLAALALLPCCGAAHAAATAEEANAANTKRPALEFIGSYGGEIRDFEQYGHYVFLNQIYTLRVLDIADPAHPAEIGWLHCDAEIDAMALKWPALYLGQGKSIKVIDVSDPAHPQPRTALAQEGRCICLNAPGHFLTVETQDQKNEHHRVYEIQKPFDPVMRFDSPTLITYPRPPRFFASTGTRCFEAMRDEKDEATGSFNDDFWSMIIKDVTTSPTILGRLMISTEASSKKFDATNDEVGVGIRQGKLVAGDSAHTTITLADATPDAPIWCFNHDGLSILQEGRRATPSSGITIQKKQGEKFIRFVDTSAGTTPAQRGTYGEDPGARQFKLSGKRGYLIDGEGGLQILDLSTPARPHLLGRYDKLGENPIIRAAADDNLYIETSSSGFQVLDCSNPTAPVLRGEYLKAAGPMSIPGQRAYVAAGKNGLQILDISKPSAIRPLGHYATPQPADDLATSGSLVYLLAGDLYVLDASHPARPVLLGKTPIEIDDGYDSPSHPNPTILKKLGLALYAIRQHQSGNYLSSYCVVIDVSNPVAPRPNSRDIFVDNPRLGDDSTTAKHVTLSPVRPSSPFAGCYLYLSSGYHRDRDWDSVDINHLEVYDLSDPLKPRFSFATHALATDDRAALYKDTIYLADGQDGLLILAPPGK